MSTATAPAAVPATFAAGARHDRILAAIDEHGYAVLKAWLPPAAVAGARRAVERMVERRLERCRGDGLIADTRADLPFETRLIAIGEACRDAVPPSFREELHEPEMHAFLCADELVELAARVVGDEVRIYPNYMVRPKLPGDWRMEIGWHQDAEYTRNHRVAGGVAVEELRTLNCWSPLLPARRANGCMQFIPGSHRLGAAPHRPYNEMHVAITPDAIAPHLHRAIDIELDPGDVVVFHNLLFHQGLPNSTRTIRWSADWRFQDATQPTLRPFAGQLVRSRARPEAAIRDAAAWGAARFG